MSFVGAKRAPDAVSQPALGSALSRHRPRSSETIGAGIEAARAAGAGLLIGIDRSGGTEELHAHGADRVAVDLTALVDPSLAA